MTDTPAREFAEAGPGLRLRALAGRLRDRNVLLLTLACSLAAVLLAAVLFRLLHEAGETNSYALLADAFLHGRLDVDRCLDSDCAHFGGKTFIVFPPLPALVAVPLVAIFGVGFSGFMALGVAACMMSMFLWWRIFAMLKIERATAVWLLLALAFATPLFYTTLRAEKVWFFAQQLDFLLVTLAIHDAMGGRRLVRAGLCIGAAFLCRQMSILLLPFLFVLALRPDEPLIAFRREHILRALKLGLSVAAAVAFYMIYNQLRFGSPLETGYIYIKVPNLDHWTLINHRLNNIGLFSKDYVPFNALYLFVQGFHLEFSGPDMLTLSGLDQMGTSLLAASPFVLFAFFTPARRAVVIGGLCAALILGITLFYHGNGYSQYNAQRFVLDWMPVLVYVLALSVGKSLRPAFGLFVTYGIALNVVTVAVLSVLKT